MIKKEGKQETYREMIKRDISTILIFILTRSKRSAEVIMVKTKTNIIIKTVKLLKSSYAAYHNNKIEE